MAVVATEVRQSRYGIALALYPGEDGYAVEIERAPDSGGSPDTGNSETIAVVSAGAQTYVDFRSGGRWHYRSRHVRSGANDGAWTQWIDATPKPIPSELPNIPPLEGSINVQVSVNDSGEVIVTADGPEQTQNLYVTVGDGSSPSDPTSGANDGSISSRSGTVNTGVTPTVGNTIHVKVVAETLGGIFSAVQEEQVPYNDTFKGSEISNNVVAIGTLQVEGNQGNAAWIFFASGGANVSIHDSNGNQIGVMGVAGGDILLQADATNANLQFDADNDILMPSLPTSDPTVAGALWNDSGTLKVSAG